MHWYSFPLLRNNQISTSLYYAVEIENNETNVKLLMWWNPPAALGWECPPLRFHALQTVMEGGNGKRFYICDEAPRMSFIWIRHCLLLAQGEPLLTLGGGLPATGVMGWRAGGRVGQLHTAASLLIMSSISYLFASGRIVCTLFYSHQGLLGFF